MLRTGRRVMVLGALGASMLTVIATSPVVAAEVATPLAIAAAVQVEPTAAQSQPVTTTAMDLMRAGRAADALALLEPVVTRIKGAGSLDAETRDALFLRAFALTELGRRADAVEALEQLTQLVPDSARYRIELAYAYRKAGEKDQALASYREAALVAAKAGEDAQRYRAAALRGIGAMLVDQGDLAGGERAYMDSLSYDPASKVAANELNYIAQKRGGIEQKGG